MRHPMTSMHRQRGVGVVELSLALIVLSTVIFWGFRTWMQYEDGRRAENQAQVLTQIRDAAETLVFEHYADFQAGLPIERNGVTLDFGEDVGEMLSPTVEQLNAMAVGLHNASPSPYYKSLSNGGYVIRIRREPAGCEATPNGQECNITGLACFDQTLADPRHPENVVDGRAIGRMLNALGANGGASLDDDGSMIYGFGGAWETDNPVPSQPVGIVCTRFGFGSAGFANFLRVRDTRDPQFQNNVTVGGGVNIQRTASNGDVCTPDEDGLIVQGSVDGGSVVLLRCNGSNFEVLNGITYANAGDTCTAAEEGRFALDPSTGAALICSSGRWISQEDRGVRTLGYYAHNAVVPAPTCPALHTPTAVVAAVSAANIIGANNAGNNTGSFQASIDSSWRVTITGSDGSTAGNSALALVITSCVRI